MTPKTNQEGDSKREHAIEGVAQELKAHDEAEAEMRANYPHLRRAVYASLREKFLRELPPLPAKELEAVAQDEGALTLEAFIDELEQLPEKT